jgi:phosphoribosylformylglycinamidine cyclo-ligase
MSEHYKAAGVDIDAGDEAVRRIAASVASTRVPGVMGAFGGFGGVFDLREAGVGPDDLLVSGTDGVGTKLRLAFLCDRHDTIGVDCVAMCVNDVLTLGARSLFFLDYLAVGRLRPEAVEAIVGGVAKGCRQAGCALIGGETAEMPGFYPPGEYDVAGFVVGAVHRDRLIDGSGIRAGDVLIGLPSSGVHSNGFSLARRLLLPEGGEAEAIASQPVGLDAPVGEVLLRPTRIYVRQVLGALAAGAVVRGMVHVTGGGLIGNTPRVLPEGLGVRFDRAALDAMNQPIFALMAERGGVPREEMYRVFNMGVGYVLITPAEHADACISALGEGRVIGEVCALGAPDEPRVRI